MEENTDDLMFNGGNGSWESKCLTPNRRQRYTTSPVVVEAEEITKDNLKSLAHWCGGIVSDEQTHDDGIVDLLLVPNPYGMPKKGRIGQYLIKHLDTGQFTVMAPLEFKSKGFEPVGVREGSIHRTTGPGRVMRGAGISPYWNYPDYPEHVEVEPILGNLTTLKEAAYGNTKPKGWGLNSDAP